MAEHYANATRQYCFRFFSPEQVDHILREGATRGRAGSHHAIERILKHEPGLARAQLWMQIRRIKQRAIGPRYQRTFWNPEDEQILRTGYERGGGAKREAVRELLRTHPTWRAHSIWRRAAKLGLVQKTVTKNRQRSGQPWTDDDDRMLLGLAGYKTAKVIAKLLHRSERAVRYRLAVLNSSSRVHFDGYARTTLARELHLGSRTIQRLIVDGLLEVRDPRITRKSLEEVFGSGRLARPADDHPKLGQSAEHPIEGQGQHTPQKDYVTVGVKNCSKPPRASRAKRIWADVARSANVEPTNLEQLITRGVLKLYDPRITESSLARFCHRYGALIQTDFLDADTRQWLVSSMNLAPTNGKNLTLKIDILRKHALVVRACKTCGTRIRGNAFFRHSKHCNASIAEVKHRFTICGSPNQSKPGVPSR